MTKVNSEIVTISNRYKNSLYNLIDSSGANNLDWPNLINKKLCHIPRIKDSSTRFLEGNCLNKNVLDRSLRLAPKTQDFQVDQGYDIIYFCLKSRRP